MLNPAPITPEGRLMMELAESIAKAKAIVLSNPRAALIELEYTETIIADSFHAHPELREIFYGDKPAATAQPLPIACKTHEPCPTCGNGMTVEFIKDPILHPILICHHCGK